jgi:dTDP-4-dehydrorhamnose reductase
MRVLITGANGQLGQDIVKVFEKQQGFTVLGTGRAALDITDADQCNQIMNTFKPDAVIHCAAYTAVDQAEAEPDKAFIVNAVGTRNLAVAAEKNNAKFCYISTDYVFDGNASTPYNEYDNTNPSGVYGKSKRAGEILTQSLCSKYFIVRTSWVFGKYGNNFVKTMLKIAKEKNNLKVVNDQIGSPTYTFDLAVFILQLISTEQYGIYHASNSGFCSWYEFAQAIFEETGTEISLEPCTTNEFPRPAPRPKYSVFDKMFIRINGFNEFRHWREALKEFLAK